MNLAKLGLINMDLLVYVFVTPICVKKLSIFASNLIKPQSLSVLEFNNTQYNTSLSMRGMLQHTYIDNYVYNCSFFSKKCFISVSCKTWLVGSDL